MRIAGHKYYFGRKPGTAPVFYHFLGLPIAFGLNVCPNNSSNLVAKVSSPAGRPVGGKLLLRKLFFCVIMMLDNDTNEV